MNIDFFNAGGYHAAPKSYADVWIRRERDGRCVLCGIQTHVLTGALFKKRTPLTIPKQVERGRCLLCMPTAEHVSRDYEEEEHRIGSDIASPPTLTRHDKEDAKDEDAKEKDDVSMDVNSEQQERPPSSNPHYFEENISIFEQQEHPPCFNDEHVEEDTPIIIPRDSSNADTIPPPPPPI